MITRVVLSHCHKDHAGGLKGIINNKILAFVGGLHLKDNGEEEIPDLIDFLKSERVRYKEPFENYATQYYVWYDSEKVKIFCENEKRSIKRIINNCKSLFNFNFNHMD